MGRGIWENRKGNVDRWDEKNVKTGCGIWEDGKWNVGRWKGNVGRGIWENRKRNVERWVEKSWECGKMERECKLWKMRWGLWKIGERGQALYRKSQSLLRVFKEICLPPSLILPGRVLRHISFLY